MSGIVERARVLRMAIEDMAQGLDDEKAVEVKELFPEWDGFTNMTRGTKVRYNGKLYTVLQDHTPQPDWNPEAAPSLFTEVLPGQGGTEIGEWVQPDSTNPYMTGDRVTFEGKTYESVIDGNVWSPSAYPAGWKEITE